MEKNILNIKSFFKVFLLSVILFSRLIADPFEFSQSTLQGFYFFISPTFQSQSFGIEEFTDTNGNGTWDIGEAFTDTDGDGLWDSNNDWLAAYRCLEWQDEVCVNVGECVGARLWDRNTCGSGVCDIPTNGDDGADYSDNYMLQGEVPVFRMYIESTNSYYDVSGITLDDGTLISPNEVSGWQNFGFFMPSLFTYFFIPDLAPRCVPLRKPSLSKLLALSPIPSLD